MKITKVRLGMLHVPLRVPFKTAVRTVNSVEDVIVEVHTDTGHIGYGEAPPTGLVTGDTTGAIIDAIRCHIAPAIIGRDVEALETTTEAIQKSCIRNTSAKAAVDMAIYDLFGKLYHIPTFRHLGGATTTLNTDITISVNSPEEMVRDAKHAVSQGYDCLKIKVGKDSKEDLLRLQSIRDAIGNDVRIRIDANQGWAPKEAVSLLDRLYQEGLTIELCEQPVKGADLEGLKYVTERSSIPILADESVATVRDAEQVLRMGAADMINIKLMKCGGITEGLKIAELAKFYDTPCMLGCMLEAKISVNAAVHLACAKPIISVIDLDGPLLCKEDPIEGGSTFNHSLITVSETDGLGITGVNNLVYLED